MSKISPLGQSMAALFTPEGDKLRATQKSKGGAASGPQSSGLFQVPGAKALAESGKPQDSLGNPSGGLGYESFRKEKKEAAEGEDSPAKQSLSPNQPILAPKELGRQFIRLSFGWEKVLLAQKKICEKAKNLFTSLEAPGKYQGQRKSSTIAEKARGSILDLDVQQVNNEKAAQEKIDKEKKSA
jgi:hypothetical protein